MLEMSVHKGLAAKGRDLSNLQEQIAALWGRLEKEGRRVVVKDLLGLTELRVHLFLLPGVNLGSAHYPDQSELARLEDLYSGEHYGNLPECLQIFLVYTFDDETQGLSLQAALRLPQLKWIENMFSQERHEPCLVEEALNPAEGA